MLVGLYAFKPLNGDAQTYRMIRFVEYTCASF